jgi:hypothetical protein
VATPTISVRISSAGAVGVRPGLGQRHELDAALTEIGNERQHVEGVAAEPVELGATRVSPSTRNFNAACSSSRPTTVLPEIRSMRQGNGEEPG